jgi:hypothetical protein
MTRNPLDACGSLREHQDTRRKENANQDAGIQVDFRLPQTLPEQLAMTDSHAIVANAVTTTLIKPLGTAFALGALTFVAVLFGLRRAGLQNYIAKPVANIAGIAVAALTYYLMRPH